MKKEIKNLKTLIIVYQRFQFSYKTMLSDCSKCRKNAEIKNPKYCKDKKRKSNAFIKM